MRKNYQAIAAVMSAALLAVSGSSVCMAEQQADTSAETTAETAADTSAGTTAETAADAAAGTTTEAAADATAEETPTTLAVGAQDENSAFPAELSDDLYSFQIQFGSDVYQFPMTYADFTSKGWVYDGDDTEQLESNARYSVLVFKNGDNQVYAYAANFDVNAQPLSSSYITGVQFDNFMIQDQAAQITLPGGVQFGVTTKDEAAAKYGTPSSEYAGSSYNKETYEKDMMETISLSFDTETNVLIGVDLENTVKPEGLETSEVSSETPALNQAYKAPTAMSDDFADYTVNVAGDLYTLPAPVSAFIANGWTIDTGDSEESAGGTDSAWVTITRDNQKIRTLAYNYDPNAVTIENCFITSVEISSLTSQLSMEISRGIKLGMTEAEVTAALGDTTAETEESGSFRYYNIAGENALDGYSIAVNTEEDSVVTISAANQPDLDVLKTSLGLQ